jgi:hypothetical protein
MEDFLFANQDEQSTSADAVSQASKITAEIHAYFKVYLSDLIKSKNEFQGKN